MIKRKKFSKLLLSSCIAGLCFVGTNSAIKIANAATTTSNLSVTATVISSCTVSTSPVSFSSMITPNDFSSNIDATGTVTVTCTSGSGYTVALGPGNNYSSGRRMTNGSSHYISYNLYYTSVGGTAWGDGTGATDGAATYAGTGSGAAQNITVYGRIPSGQNAANIPAGAYTDSVLVTVSY